MFVVIFLPSQGTGVAIDHGGGMRLYCNGNGYARISCDHIKCKCEILPAYLRFVCFALSHFRPLTEDALSQILVDIIMNLYLIAMDDGVKRPLRN